jgi:hypothetical protein
VLVRLDSVLQVQEGFLMYSVVLMMALSGGADAPTLSDVPAEPAARYGDHGHKQYRLFGGRRGGGCGCCGGCYGGCYGSSYGGCQGGWYGGGCYGCYGGRYGGWAYGSMGGGYYGALSSEVSTGASKPATYGRFKTSQGSAFLNPFHLALELRPGTSHSLLPLREQREASRGSRGRQ